MSKLESPCENCSHLGICKYQKDFITLFDALKNNKITFYLGGEPLHDKIKDFEFLEAIKLHCKFYQEYDNRREVERGLCHLD